MVRDNVLNSNTTAGVIPVLCLNVPWTVHHDSNFEAITNLMHK